MDIKKDIVKIKVQENKLILNRFDYDVAWEIGNLIRSICFSKNIAACIEVKHCASVAFFCMMVGATNENADWVRRKRNTVEFFQKSSYRVGLELLESQKNLHETIDLPLRDYASHGGGFPLWVKDVGFVGVVTMSGAPQRVDHEIVAEVLSTVCGLDFSDLKLE